MSSCIPRAVPEVAPLPQGEEATSPQGGRKLWTRDPAWLHDPHADHLTSGRAGSSRAGVPAWPHHICSNTNGNSSPLSNTLAMTNESAHVPKRCGHLGGIQVRSPIPQGGDTHLPQEQYDLDHHFSLARSLIKRDFSPRRREISTNILNTTTTEPIHKI